MSNVTTIETTTSPEFILAPWIVKPATRIVIIPGDATPQYNKAAEIEVEHMELRAHHRDLDGKYAPQEKPVTKRQAMRKLQSSSKRLNAAVDRMAAMESW